MFKKTIKLFCILLVIPILCSCSNKEEKVIIENGDQISNSVITINEEANNSLQESTNDNIPEVQPTKAPEPIERPNTVFRNACWGDSIETVKKYETVDLIEESNEGLLYLDTLLDVYDVCVVYKFENDSLCKCGYTIKNNYTTGGQYINAYYDLQSKLKSLYGEPIEDEIYKFEDDMSIELAGESSALTYGYVKYRTVWNTGDVEIALGTFSENYQENLVITYSDPNYVEDLSKSGL